MRARCLGGRRVGPRTLRAALVPGILAFEDVERVGDWGRSGASPELWLWVCGAHWVGMGVCEGRGLGRSLRALASNGWNWFSLQPARKASLSAGVRAESFGQRGPLRAPGIPLFVTFQFPGSVQTLPNPPSPCHSSFKMSSHLCTHQNGALHFPPLSGVTE